jgi:hypothetical protein
VTGEGDGITTGDGDGLGNVHEAGVVTVTVFDLSPEVARI